MLKSSRGHCTHPTAPFLSELQPGGRGDSKPDVCPAVIVVQGQDHVPQPGGALPGPQQRPAGKLVPQESIGTPARLTAGMSPPSLCAKPLHMRLRAQHPAHWEDVQTLPGEPAPNQAGVMPVTPPACRTTVSPSPAVTHTNKEPCRGQGAWREATPQLTCPATFRDDLYSAGPGWSATHVLALPLGSQSRN